jgi:hypothetical protein
MVNKLENIGAQLHHSPNDLVHKKQKPKIPET